MAILLSFGVLIITVLLVHTFLLYRESREVAERLPRARAARAARDAGEMLERVGEHLSLAASFTDEALRIPPPLIALFQKQLPLLRLVAYDAEGREQWVRDFVATGDMQRIALLPPESRERELAQFFAQVFRGEQYRSAPFYRADGVPQLLWAFPLWGEEGAIRGVLAAYIDFRPWVSVLSYESDITIRLIDAQGKTLWPIRTQGVGGTVPRVPTPADIAFARGDNRVFSYTSPAGTKMLAAWEPLRGTDWAVVAEVPARRVYESVYLSLTILISFGVVMLVMLVVTARFFRRHVHRPLVRMREGVERFAHGDFTARMEESRGDELGLLARAFNAMAARIADEPLHLQKEVEYRTKALEQANEKLARLVRQVQDNARQLMEKEQRLMEANERLRALNRDMDRVGKILVRRDRELSEANARLEELDKVKSEFVSVAAHQLRTPLTGIRWSLMSLANGEMGPLNEDQKTMVRNGLTAAESAITLINDLLDIARIEGGRFDYTFKVAPLAKTLETAVARLRQRARRKGVTLRAEKMPEDICMHYDPDRLEMALENAIDNAVKYTEPHGEVRVTFARKGDKVVVSVRDTGIGIPKEEQHRLFSKFFRAPNAQLMQTSGTGLGLYLMKKIVEGHGGEVAIESEEGKGTTVIFTFPTVPCAPVQQENQGEDPAAAGMHSEGKEDKGALAPNAPDGAQTAPEAPEQRHGGGEKRRGGVREPHKRRENSP